LKNGSRQYPPKAQPTPALKGELKQPTAKMKIGFVLSHEIVRHNRLHDHAGTIMALAGANRLLSKKNG
jgi:hypothetical protein